MLLGTNPQPALPREPYVSIPREDSCFWERVLADRARAMLPVSIPREDSCFWELL